MQQAYGLRSYPGTRCDLNAVGRQPLPNLGRQLEPSLRDLILRPKSKGIPRPPNAFMVFAREHRRKLAAEYPRQNNKKISSLLGERWRKLDQPTRKGYFDKATMLKDLHQRQYPGYVYSPRLARLKKLARINKSRQKNSGRSPVNDTGGIKSEPIDQETNFHDSNVEDHCNSDVFEEKDATNEYVPNNPEYFSLQQSEQVVYNPQGTFWNSAGHVYPFDQGPPWGSAPYDQRCMSMQPRVPPDSHGIQSDSCDASFGAYSNSPYRSTSSPNWKSRQAGCFNGYSGSYQTPGQGEFADLSSTDPRKGIRYHSKNYLLPYGSNVFFQQPSSRPEEREFTDLSSTDSMKAIRFQPKNLSSSHGSNTLIQQPSSRPEQREFVDLSSTDPRKSIRFQSKNSSLSYGSNTVIQQPSSRLVQREFTDISSTDPRKAIRYQSKNPFPSCGANTVFQPSSPRSEQKEFGDLPSIDPRKATRFQPQNYSSPYDSNAAFQRPSQRSEQGEFADILSTDPRKPVLFQPKNSSRPYNSNAVFQQLSPRSYFYGTHPESNEEPCSWLRSYNSFQPCNAVGYIHQKMDNFYSSDRLSGHYPNIPTNYSYNSNLTLAEPTMNSGNYETSYDRPAVKQGTSDSQIASPSSKIYCQNVESEHDQTSDNEILNVVDVDENSLDKSQAADEPQPPLSQLVSHSSENVRPHFDSGRDHTSDNNILNIVDVDKSSLSGGYALDGLQPELSQPVSHSIKISLSNLDSGNDQISDNEILNIFYV